MDLDGCKQPWRIKVAIEPIRSRDSRSPGVITGRDPANPAGDGPVRWPHSGASGNRP
jgi:hypothetical protein